MELANTIAYETLPSSSSSSLIIDVSTSLSIETALHEERISADIAATCKRVTFQ